MPPSALPTDAPAAAPVQILRPGVPVLKRDPETLQVGLAPPLAARFPDHPAIRDLLVQLRGGRSPGPLPATADAALTSLRAADLVLEVPADAADAEAAGDGPARAQFGSDAARRAAQRAAHRVGVRADRPSAALVAELLDDADLARDDEQATVWLIVAAGEVPRTTVDPLQRAGVPHLLVSGRQGTRRVGPLVDPGVTACLRCVDAHEAATDPRLPFLLEQAAGTGGVGDPVDPVLERLALSWAVRDLTRYAEGDEPSTWSATVDIGPTATPETIRRLRHPHCGCAWDTLLDIR